MEHKRKHLMLMIFALCIVALLVAYCSDPDFNNPFDSKSEKYAPYTLTVNIAPQGSSNDSASRSPNQNYYRHGAQVTVTAPAAKNGYRFTGWSGASSSTDSQVTIMMDGNKTLTANFEVDVTVPSVPTGVSAEVVSSSSITVRWNTVLGATGYYIYRGTDARGAYIEVGSSNKMTSFTDMELSASTTYYYRVAAYNDAGTGIQSNTVSAMTRFEYGEQLFDSRDDKTYKTVKIGSQTWMAENLNYAPASGNSWCYGNSADSCAKYGRLYDWSTAMADSSSSDANPSGVQGVCPEGWHLPSDAEWDVLINAVDPNAGSKLKSTSGWSSGYNGDDIYGFSALPGGLRYSNGIFNNVGRYGYWWTATEYNAADALSRSMFFENSIVFSENFDKTNGFSVRCISD